MKNYYEILDVLENASEEEIKRSFRKKAIQFHPDKNPNDKGSEGKFKEANEAYLTLSNLTKRLAYDLTLEEERIKQKHLNQQRERENALKKERSKKSIFVNNPNIDLGQIVFMFTVLVLIVVFISCLFINNAGNRPNIS